LVRGAPYEVAVVPNGEDLAEVCDIVDFTLGELEESGCDALEVLDW
jgi:hypothetical protein